MSYMLKVFESQIILAAPGLEAIKTSQNNPDIDLVLMEIKMQGLDGYEATRQIREFNKEVVIIAQTAFALDGYRHKAINAGCNFYILKPISREALLDLISQYVY